MRVKTDDRRRAIMEAAGAVFQRDGFEGASMAAISSSLGGSKATLYSYFESKEELYEAVMMEMVEEQVGRFFAILDNPTGDLRQLLLGFGTAYLSWMLSQDVVAVTRSGIESRERDGLGRRLFEHGPKRCWKHVADLLEREMTAGRLRKAMPLAAALHLKGLLQAGLFEPYLFGAPPLLSRRSASSTAVDVFLRAYRTDEPVPASPRRSSQA